MKKNNYPVGLNYQYYSVYFFIDLFIINTGQFIFFFNTNTRLMIKKINRKYTLTCINIKKYIHWADHFYFYCHYYYWSLIIITTILIITLILSLYNYFSVVVFESKSASISGSESDSNSIFINLGVRICFNLYLHSSK